MESINLIRKDGTRVENEMELRDGRYLGVIISGLGYTYRNPLLYYSKKVLLEKDFDYLGLDYKYYENKEFLEMNEMDKDKYFEEDNAMIIDMIDKLAGNYEKVILIGKSMGTSIIRRYIKSGRYLNKCSFVLITPGPEWSEIINDLKELDNRTLLISSLEDKYYLVKNLSDIYKKKNLHLYELEHGNHLLENNNAEADLDTLKNIIKEILLFVDKL